MPKETLLLSPDFPPETRLSLLVSFIQGKIAYLRDVVHLWPKESKQAIIPTRAPYLSVNSHMNM